MSEGAESRVLITQIKKMCSNKNRQFMIFDKTRRQLEASPSFSVWCFLAVPCREFKAVFQELSNCINFYVPKVISVEYPAVCCGDGNFPEKSYWLTNLYVKLPFQHKMQLRHTNYCVYKIKYQIIFVYEISGKIYFRQLYHQLFEIYILWDW